MTLSDRAAIRQRCERPTLDNMTRLVDDVPKLLDTLDQAEQQRKQLTRLAADLCCTVTLNRCKEFGCAHEGALIESAKGWKCPACAIYGAIASAGATSEDPR